MPTRDVESGAPYGADALARRRPAPALLPRAIHLALVEGAHVLHGDPEALFEIGRESLAGQVYLVSRYTDRIGAHAVEALRVIEEGRISALAHVLYYAARGGTNLLGEETAGAA